MTFRFLVSMSGRPMAAIAHNVVGLQHATMAIFNAWVDRAPVLVLGGTGPMDTTRRRPWIDWVHTANVQGNLVRDYVKFDDQPASLAAVPDALYRAYRSMCLEPTGPVYVCFDAAIQEDRVPAGLTVPDPKPYVETSRPGADLAALARAADWLAAAERPAIAVGRFGRHPESVPALAALAELLGAPVISSEERFNLPNTHPLNLSGADADVIRAADLILALDVWDLAQALNPRDGSGQTRPTLQAETKIVEIKLGDLAVRSWTHDFQTLVPTDLSIVADSSVCLGALTELVRERLPGRRAVGDQRRARWTARHDELRATWRREAAARAEESPIAVAAMAAAVWETIRDEDWVLAYHSHNPWPRRLWELDAPYRYASGPTGGGVGVGIGLAAGVALAHRNSGRIVVSLQADGDLLYCTSALWTVAHDRLPLLMVMHNNRSYYNSAEHAQRMAERRGRPLENHTVGTA
ncbi:MAG: thiamine pyrophosphate-binding protein, partial [Chloroflexi bacterium]|nr:thiamine pyrophosphate-binding protein [Chloroflexota bacterium]